MEPFKLSSLWQAIDFTANRYSTTEKSKSPRLSRKRDIFLAFVIVSLPLLAISVLLLAFVFLSDREKPANYQETPNLPFFFLPPLDAFYTRVPPGSFLLLASWASNIAEFVVAPFMVLFSYAVAHESLRQSFIDPKGSPARPLILRQIMRGTYVGMWDWIRQKPRRSDRNQERALLLRVVDVAGLGLFTASLLTVLVVVGDNWLHATTITVQFTHYENLTNPTTERELMQLASISLSDPCEKTITAALPQNISSAPLPCSLNKTNWFTNVANPETAYLTLGTGISQVSSSFNGLNFTSLDDAEDEGTGSSFQVVTYVNRDGLSHSLLFYPDAAAEYDFTDYGFGPHYGIDYLANSTSMVTQCTFATEECNIHSTDSSNENNISIPFHCYNDFYGDLGRTPFTGHERAQGWNMSFYQSVSGTPLNIPVQTQSNPFHFYAAAAVNSISIGEFEVQSNLTEGSPGNESLVDGGSGFTAFALSCEATIYDVTFSIINGSFSDFNTTKSSPQKASIIQAPLQVGFGLYHLYQSASLAVLATNESVSDTMAKAFSQTGMALASGAFILDNTTEQRYRWQVSVTKVPKAPFFYLVSVCLVYSVFGIMMTILAVCLRRRPEVKDQQARLMVEWGPELLEMDHDRHREEKRNEVKREGEADSRDSSGDVMEVFE